MLISEWPYAHPFENKERRNNPLDLDLKGKMENQFMAIS